MGKLDISRRSRGIAYEEKVVSIIKESTQNPGQIERSQIRQTVEQVINATPVMDIHTHLFSPAFGDMALSGIDELLTYHYLVAETFRSSTVRPDEFWRMTKQAQADLVWKTLFVENFPLSEAARGVITVLNAFGLNTSANDLTEAREFFSSQDKLEHIDRVLKMANVESVVMTNDPFDANESRIWEEGVEDDKRFLTSLRMDRLLNDWNNTAAKLQVDAGLNERTVAEVRKCLDEWIVRMRPTSLAVSLPDDFIFPVEDARNTILQKIVFPTAREHNIPFALMIGVRRRVNPALQAAGDGVGRADVSSLERICAENPDVKFLSTFLSRENQHELCVAARKFSNLTPFGCWWFLNNPSTIEEIMRERIEMLGTSFIPQHSDARVLEQLIYKWSHSRKIFVKIFADAYEQIFDAGRAVTVAEIERDIKKMFADNFTELIARKT